MDGKLTTLVELPEAALDLSQAEFEDALARASWEACARLLEYREAVLRARRELADVA